MKALLFALATIFAIPAFAIYQVGDVIPNICWKNELDASFCLEDVKDTVRVLNYSTGWCPYCNDEMQVLVPKAKEYEGLAVTFLSLSAASFESGGAPTPEFLKAWKEKHAIPFPVLASPKDAGRKFFEPPYSIPNFVIIDKSGKLAYKSQDVTLVDLFREIDKLL